MTPPSSIPILSATNLSLKTPCSKIEEQTIEIFDREWVEIIGPSRSGKSLLFQLFSLRSIVPNATFTFKNYKIDKIPSAQLAQLRKSIGSCAQNPIFLEERTVVENLVLPPIIRGHSNDARLQAEDLLANINAEALLNVKIKHLSYQDRILVGVLRALIDDPELIIIDSVIENLSLEYQDLILESLQNQFKENSTIVLFAYDPLKVENRAKVYDLNPTEIITQH